ncbi:MAG TPA: hypothetical protein GX509_01845 [Firmicutes bacterium]|nr:hypothetical protein [Bacillota bacterium]HHY97461.1 hypothetical protein [Bacillota bacterium]
MTRLYETLCEACSHYLFPSNDPFGAVGITQTAFYRDVVALQKASNPPSVWTREAIRLITREWPYSLFFEPSLTSVLLEFLNTAPLKEEAINQADRLRRECQLPHA